MTNKLGVPPLSYEDWMAVLRERAAGEPMLRRHYGPGPHKSGTSQAVHGPSFGDTVHPVDGRRPTTGYQVGQPTGSMIMPREDYDKDAGKSAGVAFVERNREVFRNNPDVYMGVWLDKDKGEIDLDVSHNIQSRSEAIRQAREWDQQAIWDNVRGQAINVGGTGAREHAESRHQATGQLGRDDRGREEGLDGAPAGRGSLRGVDPDVSEALERFYRHLPGQHDQKTHGHGFGTTGGATTDAVNKKIAKGIEDGSGQLALSPKARAKIDATIAKYNIDTAAIDADMDRAFGRPAFVEFGRTWYVEEYGGEIRRIAETREVSPEIATAAIAITSARNRWRTDDGVPINADIAAAHIDHWKANPGTAAADLAESSPTGYLKGRGFGLNVYEMLTEEKTIDEAVTGSKRRSFYNNGSEPEVSWDITNDTRQAVYVSAHSSLSQDQVQSMLSSGAAPKYLADEGVMASPMYVILTEATMRAHVRNAARVGFTRPHQTQATTWALAPELGAKEE